MNDSPYELRFSKRALRSLSRLDKEDAAQIVKRLERMAGNVQQERHKALKGNWQGYFSLRVGVYRVIYRIEHEQRMIFAEKIGHRREVYEE
ncbi:MAG: type II toxin-antitoxin system RelE/ParE family toxin [Chloroflexi bacterium]|nr:type II toxin-antitoxin system RelE/ParE family toxin [Chloroflexota bacterium]